MTAVPAGNSVGLTTNGNTFVTYTDYGLQSANVAPLNFITMVKARGNSSSPTTAFNNDTAGSMSFNVYNGNTYPRVGRITVSAPNASSLPNSNVVWSGGILNLFTGNPNGNTTSTTATNNQNLIQLDQFGRYSVLPGGPGACASASFTNFGSNSDGSGGGLTFNINRGRGNRDSMNTAVANTDIVGGFAFNAYNGTGAGFAGNVVNQVNTAYGTIVAGNPWIPSDTIISAASNTQAYTTTFRGNGEVSFPGNVLASNNITGANIVVNTSGFMKLASYTEAALTAITGQIGWMAAVSDSAQGSNPNGMIAFWDTTNSRWSYIHDNGAV
jgi:hypothetical protein